MSLRLLIVFFLFTHCLNAEIVRVATYNVENYMSADRTVDGKFKKDYPKPESEKTALRQVIKTVSPHVLAIQEIGGAQYLKELQEDLMAEGVHYPYSMIVKNPGGVRFLALLSKLPIIDEEHHHNIQIKNNRNVVRGLLEATFHNNNKTWKLYAAHLKSKIRAPENDPNNNLYRMKEAEAIREKVREDFPNGSNGYYLIVGDLNDGPNSATLKRFKKVGKRILSIPLKATDSRNETWTEHSWFQGAYYQLDYICVSPKMLELVENKGASIFDAPYTLNASDHRMLYTDIDF